MCACCGCGTHHALVTYGTVPPCIPRGSCCSISQLRASPISLYPCPSSNASTSLGSCSLSLTRTPPLQVPLIRLYPCPSSSTSSSLGSCSLSLTRTPPLQVPPISLYPCPSSNSSSSLGGCAAAARSSSGQDLSGNIQDPYDATVCDSSSSSSACVRCVHGRVGGGYGGHSAV